MGKGTQYRQETLHDQQSASQSQKEKPQDSENAEMDHATATQRALNRVRTEVPAIWRTMSAIIAMKGMPDSREERAEQREIESRLKFTFVQHLQGDKGCIIQRSGGELSRAGVDHDRHPESKDECGVVSGGVGGGRA